MKIVNKLDYIYKKLLYEAKLKMNDTIEISDEEAIELGLINNEENNDETEHDYSKDYFTIEVLEDGIINFDETGLYTKTGLKYSLDKDNWYNLDTINGLNISKDSIIYFKCIKTPQVYEQLAIGSMFGIGTFNTTCKFNVFGNIMSLYYGDNFINNDLSEYTNWGFYKLFCNCNKLISAENLILPSLVLSLGSYACMFAGCTSLISMPKLPATTLADYCYQYMFYGCTSLINIPEFPATILANGCYSGMFQNCTSLITTPTLRLANLSSNNSKPETIKLADKCYLEMFAGCTNLNYIKCLLLCISENLLINWVENISPTGTFVKLQGIEFQIGPSGIPQGWTVQELDPDTGEIVNEYIAE